MIILVDLGRLRFCPSNRWHLVAVGIDPTDRRPHECGDCRARQCDDPRFAGQDESGQNGDTGSDPRGGDTLAANQAALPVGG